MNQEIEGETALPCKAQPPQNVEPKKPLSKIVWLCLIGAAVLIAVALLILLV